MNSTVTSLVQAPDCYTSQQLPQADARNLFGVPSDLVLAFLLATCIAAILGSQRAFYHGLLSILLNLIFWQRSSSLRFQTSNDVLSLAACIAVLWAGSKISRFMWPENVPHSGALESNVYVQDKHRYNAQPDISPLGLPLFKPLLFPCGITHRRFYPIKHDFKYSRLFVGIPVLHNPPHDNSWLSSHPISHQEQQQAPRVPAWLSVQADEYLQRGPAFKGLTLRARLDMYLRSQNVADPQGTFPYAYLVTAPNFLGRALNQVCFWYLYDVRKILSAVIFEVNSTFDERRIFFANAKDPEDGENPGSRFSSVFKKDFHVSPFHDRHGTFSTKVTDILRTGRVDITIVLIPDSQYDASSTTSKGPSLVSRLFSETDRVDPATLSASHGFLFLLRHGWGGFLAEPRVLVQARKLWAKGMPVFYRPEPLKTTIARIETQEETVVEQRFRGLLACLSLNTGIHMTYSPAAGLYRGQTIRIGRGTAVSKDAEVRIGEEKQSLQLLITTPAFYSELLKFHTGNGNLIAAFERLCFNADEKQRMAECSSPTLLRTALAGISTDSRSQPKRYGDQGVDVGPPQIRNVPTLRNMSSILFARRIDLRSGTTWNDPACLLYRLFRSSASDLDHQIRQNSSPNEYRTYVHAACVVLFADRIALGSTWLLRLEFGLLRVLAVLVTTVIMERVVRSTGLDIPYLFALDSFAKLSVTVHSILQ